MFVYYIHGFRFRGVYCFTPCLYGDNDMNFIVFFNVFLADDSPWRIKKKADSLRSLNISILRDYNRNLFFALVPMVSRRRLTIGHLHIRIRGTDDLSHKPIPIKPIFFTNSWTTGNKSVVIYYFVRPLCQRS